MVGGVSSSQSRRLAGLALVIALAPASWAGESGVEGYWTGTVDVDDGKTLEIMIDLARKDAGWRAAFYAPAQGIHGVELTGVEIADRKVKFRIPNSEGDPTFRGELAADGRSISGSLDQAGQTHPFRVAPAKRPEGLGTDIYAEYRQPGAIGVGLAGKWRGLLMTGPNRMRLALHVESRDGKLNGWVVSLDQGGQAMAVDGFKLDGESVRFEITDIGALYRGKMKPDGSEFYGVWIQNGTEFPLTFRRTSPAAEPKSAG